MRVTKLDHPGMESYLFECPGCEHTHMITVAYEAEYKKSCESAGRNTPCWTFNGSLDLPTFNPSLLVRGKRVITDDEHKRIMAGEKLDIPDFVCHSFIRDGKIQFLGDCTHALTNQTVDLREVVKE